MTRLGLSTPFLFAAVLAGCASVPPPAPPELPVEVPEGWIADPAAVSPAPPDDDWWRALGGERLAALVAEALAGNRDLAAAAARVEAAAAQARIAGAPLWPQADGSFNASRRRQNFLGFPIPGGEERVLSNTTTSLQAALDVSWELDLWGRLRAAEGAAVANAQAVRADLAAARLSLAGQTAKAWFGVLEASEQAALARATVDNRRGTERRLRRRWESGLAEALDLRLAMASRASAEALLAQRESQLEAARRRLELLLGRYPDGDLATGGPRADGPRAIDPAALPPLPPGAAAGTPPAPERVPAPLTAAGTVEPVPAGLPAELLVRRPDLLAAERRLAAAGLSVDEARAARLPAIRLTGSAGRSSQELEDLLDSDFTVWSLAANLLQPIFQGGRLAAAVDLAEARRREALAGWVSAALAAFADVEQALAAEGWLAARLAALEEATEQSLEARELSEQRYLAGLTPYLSVLESQRQALAAESELLAARRARLDTRVDLHLALGGGFAADADLAAGADPEQITPAVPNDTVAPPGAAPGEPR
jgi:outer membrane protein, multidrug efflux system